MKEIIVNMDDYEENFWGRNFRIHIGPFSGPFVVNASCLGDAIDELADYCNNNNLAYLFTHEEAAELEFPEDYITGGNEGWTFNEISIHAVEF